MTLWTVLLWLSFRKQLKKVDFEEKEPEPKPGKGNGSAGDGNPSHA